MKNAPLFLFAAIAAAIVMSVVGVLAYAEIGATQHGVEIIPHDAYGDIRMVVPIDQDDPAALAFRLNNIANSDKAIASYGGKLTARVDLYGPGVKLFDNPSPELAAVIDQARSAGVQFRFCHNSLNHFNLSTKDLYFVKPSEVVPSGFLEVAYLQTRGWVINP